MSSSICVECCAEIIGVSKLVLCSSCFCTPYHRTCLKKETPDTITCAECSTKSKVLTKDSKNNIQMQTLLKVNHFLRVELVNSRKESLDLRSKIMNIESTLSRLVTEVHTLNESRDNIPSPERRRKMSRTLSGRRDVTRSDSRHSRLQQRVGLPSQAQRTDSPHAPVETQARPVLTGVLALSSRLRTVKTLDSYKKVFASRFAPDCTPKDIYEHLGDHQIIPVRVSQLRPKRVGLYTSFCIVCPDEATFDKCMSPQCWPVDSIISEFSGTLSDRLVIFNHPPLPVRRPDPASKPHVVDDGTKSPSPSSSA